MVRQNNNYIERRWCERERPEAERKKGRIILCLPCSFVLLRLGLIFWNGSIFIISHFIATTGAAAECTLFNASYCQAFCVTEKFLKLLRRAETKGKYTVLLLISKTKRRVEAFMQNFLDSVETEQRYCEIF